MIHENIIKKLSKVFGGFFITPLGSYRRGKEKPRDLDLGISKDHLVGINSKELLENFEVCYMLLRDKESGIMVEINVCESENTRGCFEVYLTGPMEFNRYLMALARAKGWVYGKNGLFEKATGNLIETYSEEDVFLKLGIDYVSISERNLYVSESRR